MPFPREDTTPPVTKMYLVAFGPVVIRPALEKRASGLLPVEDPPAVSTPGSAGSSSRATPMRQAVVQRPELLQPLGLFRRTGRQR